MKSVLKFFITAFAFLFAFGLLSSIYAQDKPDIQDYSLKVENDYSNQICKIKFKISQDFFVLISAKNINGSKEEIIAEGEVDRGEHTVIFKTHEKFSTDNTIFKMEVFTIESHSKLYSIQIE